MSAQRPAGDPVPARAPAPAEDVRAAVNDRVGEHGRAAEPVTITVCPDGPLLVRGDYQLLDGEDRSIAPGRATVALCRCGASSIKPFCDGTHKRTGFRAR